MLLLSLNERGIRPSDRLLTEVATGPQNIALEAQNRVGRKERMERN